MSYTDVFGGANIYPSEITYESLALTGDVTLNWPTEASAASNFAARIMDIESDQAGREITLPDANGTGNGQTILFNNVGSYTIIIKNADGVQVAAPVAGSVWQLYLADNSTEAGVWEAFQFGASVASANAAALAGTGLVAIGAQLSQSMPVSSFSSNYTAGVSDRARTMLWTSAGSGVLTLPDPATVGNNWFIALKNSGGGAIVATPPGTVEIDGSSTKSFSPGDSALIVSDGVDFITIGFGQEAIYAFDYTAIDVAGSGAYTLSGTELNRIAYNFTGALTGNRQIVVPDTVQQYWVNNSTTGSYTLTVKTSGGSGVAVTQGGRTILYCDGSEVLQADTGGIALPVAISQGGTGATTASAARINLGATSVGDALFTAATQQAAVAALGTISGGAF